MVLEATKSASSLPAAPWRAILARRFKATPRGSDMSATQAAEEPVEAEALASSDDWLMMQPLS